MKVYYAPRIMKSLQTKREAELMHKEDLESLSYRCSEKIQESYEKGRKDLLCQISSSLSKIFTVPFPSTSPEALLGHLTKTLQNSESFFLIKRVECSVRDLYRLLKDTEKLIQLSEQNISNEGRLKLKKLKLNVKINKDQQLLAEKEMICKMFNAGQVNNKMVQFICALQEEIQEMKTEKQEFNYIEEPIEEYREIPEYSASKFSMNVQEMIELQSLRKQKQMIKEQEWEKHQIDIVNEKCRNKKKKIKNKELQLMEFEKYLKIKNIEIEKEKSELERLKNNYYREKKRIQMNFENKTVKINEFLKELALSIDTTDTYGKVSPLTETEMMSDISYLSDIDNSFDNSSVVETDPSILQKRIAELEEVYRSENAHERKEKIRKDLDSLKNSLTNLRSSLVLKRTSNTQKKFSAINSYNSNKNWFTPKARSSIHSGLRTTVNSPTGQFHFSFADIKEKDEDYEFQRHLRLKEARLNEKEEGLEKERARLIERLAKIPSANQVIPFVQREIFEYKKKNEELDKKLKDIEKKELNFEIRESDLKKTEKEVQEKSRELSETKLRLEEEKISIMQKLGKLKDEVER